MKTDLLSNASGSAYVELGDTKVTVAVHGPKPSEGKQAFTERGTLRVHVVHASFSSKTRVAGSRAPTAQQDQAAKQLEEALQTIIMLDAYPKALIEVHAVVLEQGGSAAAALMMAAGLAACDAGLEMRCVLSSASVVTVGRNMLVDPTLDEEAAADRRVLVAMHSARQQIAHVEISGTFAASELKEALELAISACAFYDGHLREVLQQGLRKALGGGAGEAGVGAA